MDELADLREQNEVTLLLDAYRNVSARTDKETAGWVCRLDAVDGLSDDDIAIAHGNAIAADLLEIKVEDATLGLRYRPRKAA